MKRVLTLILVVLLALTVFIGCEEQATKVKHNLDLEADNFNLIRQVTCINAVTDTVVFQMTGRISILSQDEQEIVVLVEYAPGLYAKHMLYKGDNGILVVEQTGPAQVDQYNYTLNFNPKLWIPVRVDTVD